jgi:hypothetical protein
LDGSEKRGECIDMATENANVEFVKEQYSQYWEMMRFHLSLSWNIPTLAIAAVVALVALDPEKLVNWRHTPVLLAAAFLVMGLFVVVMFIHHHRNLEFAGIYEVAISELEKDYGVVKEVHHGQLATKLKGLMKISSSICLERFLLLFAIVLLGLSGYFWIKAIF